MAKRVCLILLILSPTWATYCHPSNRSSREAVSALKTLLRYFVSKKDYSQTEVVFTRYLNAWLLIFIKMLIDV